MTDAATQTDLAPEVTQMGRESFRWEHLPIDREEKCKARFRHLLEKNSFMKGTIRSGLLLTVERFVTEDRSLEAAIDLMYRVNYVGGPYERKEIEIFMAIRGEISAGRINHPECLLVDPKLLMAFFRCYYNETLGPAYLETAQRALIIKDESFIGDDFPIPPFRSFRVENSYNGRIALWLWQCQFLILDQPEISWAIQVEIIYNWIRFVLIPPSRSVSPNIPDEATITEFEAHIVRSLGDIAGYNEEFSNWWLVLSGFFVGFSLMSYCG